MDAPNYLCVGDKMYLEQQEVIVKEIFEIFHLVGIIDADSKFYVDASALTATSDNKYSISIRYFGRRTDEQDT